MRTAIGRPLGVILLASLDPSAPLGADDLRSVEVVTDLTAMAMEGASLLETEARRARDELRLKRAAEAVSGSLEAEEVHRRVVDHAASVTGGSKALLTRLDSRARELRAVASVDFSLGEEGGRLSLDGGAVGQVARTRSAVLLRRADAEGQDDRMMRTEGIGCFMHAPLELGPRLYGVLSVAHEDPDRFGNEDLELLVQLARSSTAAIANAIDFERERRIARALTLGFVPESLPELPGYETGLLYSPAAGEPTGGDIYGIWKLPDGDVALLIGDVAGKGVETAALSAMVRFFVEARSWDETSPATVLAQTNAMLGGRLPGRQLRDRLHGRALRGLAPVLPTPDTCRRCWWRTARHAAWTAPRCRSGWSAQHAVRRGRAGPPPGRAALRLHRRPDRGPPLGRAASATTASPGWWRTPPAGTPRRIWSRSSTARSPAGRAASPTTPWRSRFSAVVGTWSAEPPGRGSAARPVVGAAPRALPSA